MQPSRALDRLPRFTAALVVIAAFMCPPVSFGQAIVPDTAPGRTLGTAVTNTGVNYAISGGTSSGTNLFHSFTDFSVPTGGSATFNGPQNTSNVFSRVTGGQPSTIDGLISSRAAMPNANFFLLNPAGVIFGPSASIDVGGTFHASSTERIFFEGGGEFSATPVPGELLSSAPPQAFGFLGSNAAISTDGTLGTVVVDNGGDFTIGGGTYKGTNLFHSFGEFSLPGGSATFDGLPSTENVISRVTGGNQSIIDGVISTRAAMPSANFFLVNPAGVMFGLGAFLDIAGSVHISTADRVIFPGQVFWLTPQANELSLLSSAPPDGLRFDAIDPAGIDVFGAFLMVDPHDGVAGRTLSLVGGDVTLAEGAVLFAPGGTIRIVSVDSPGTVNLGALDLGLSSFARLGNVTIREFTTVAAGDATREGLPGPGGPIVIRSGRLVVESEGLVTSDTADFGAPAVGVDVQARESVVVDSFGSIQTSTTGSDDASRIAIVTGNLTLSDGGSVQSSAPIAGASGKSGAIDLQVDSANLTGGGAIRAFSRSTGTGNVTVAATGSVTLSGPTTEIVAGTGAQTGNVVAGDISITATDVVLADQARLRSGGGIQQAGKKIEVTATNTLNISGLAGILSQGFSGEAGAIEISAGRLAMDAGFVNASTLGAGGAGTINAKAGSVTLVNGAQIASSTALAATNQAGNIAIEADSVTISGRGPATGSVGSVTFTNDRSSGVFSTSSGTGRAGSITILTPSLTLAELAKISVAAKGSGNAGTIVANLGSANIGGGARIDSSTNAGGAGGAIEVSGALLIGGTGSGLFSTASGAGDAGAITVNSPTLTLTDGARIAVTTTAAGDAGMVIANVGSFNIAGGARVDSSTTAGGAGGAIGVNGALSVSGSGSGLFSTASSTGNAGVITVSGPAKVSNGGTIDSSTNAGGAGGAINVKGTLSVTGTGSGLFSTASGSGSAGVINVTGPTVLVADGGTIDSSTTGAGAGGAINVNAASQVEISGGGSVRADSLGIGHTGSVTIGAGDRILMDSGSISTRAARSDGGNITLMAPNIIRLNNSQITTSVESGTGGGGNIFIDPQFVILNGSSITANAFGGPGGNVTIIADNFVADPSSLVTASSALSTPGSVEIRSPENNLASDIAQLPKELVDASRLMQSACSARRAGASSSFTVAGRGGVPVDPDGYLPSYSMSEAPAAAAPRAGYGFMLAMAGSDCWR